MSDRDDPRKTIGTILDRGLFAEHRDVSETCSIYRTVTPSPHTDRVLVVWWSTCHVCEVDEPHTDETAATTWCHTHRCVGEEDE